MLRYHSHDRRTRKPRHALLVLLGCLAASAYFVHYTISGTYGLAARSRLIERSSALDREIASLEAVRRRLRHDVELLASEPPQSDIVEELARSVLGFARPQDLTVIEGPAGTHPGTLAQAGAGAR